MPVPITSVKFWINAFIPLSIPGYTLAVPNHGDLTMIPGPGVNPLSDCYHTDQRSFSNNIGASSRMHSEAKVEFGAAGTTMTQSHHCDETVECDCEDGDEECRKKGKTNRMSFTMLPSLTAPTPNRGPFPTPIMPIAGTSVARLKIKAAANNPCAPSSTFGGDIDYEGIITIDPNLRKIECDIKIDAFPAFEAYATINDGAGVMMFQIAPPLGNTVMNLPGPASRAVKCVLEDLDGDGIFEKLTQITMP